MRILLKSRDQLWLCTRGLGDIGVSWYAQEDGYLRRVFPNPTVAVAPTGGGWTIQISSETAAAAVWVPGPPPRCELQGPANCADMPDDADFAAWATTCALHAGGACGNT